MRQDWIFVLFRCIRNFELVVTWHRRLVTFHLEARFDTSQSIWDLWFETAELREVFSKYFGFPLCTSFHHMLYTHFRLCIAVIRMTKGTSLGNFKKMYFGNGELWRESTFTIFWTSKCLTFITLWSYLIFQHNAFMNRRNFVWVWNFVSQTGRGT
jgi:hypothetical protein